MKINRPVLSQIFRRGPVVFDRLEVVKDGNCRSAAMNMAIDEALLESVKVSSIRFYRWTSPALSFGYFGKFADVASYASQWDLVRRWTGGGIVFHGQDLTYSIVIPASDPIFDESPMSIYERIHRALRDSLGALGQPEAVVIGDSENYSRADRGTGINDAGYNGHCFANPVRADVMVTGRKVAGAAQRRTRTGLLQQGSIQLATARVRVPKAFGTGHVDLPMGFETRFARELSGNCAEQKIDNEILKRAREIAARKYGTEKWLRRF
jgi:lipoate-protein ligase A